MIKGCVLPLPENVDPQSTASEVDYLKVAT